MIALITPTGGRSKQIELCAKFMHQQDYQGKVLWIIVDDVVPITTDCISEDFKENWKIIKIHPNIKWQSGMNTQARNLLIAIAVINSWQVDSIFIIEDDDYYSQSYLTVMTEKLKGNDLIGEQDTIYYSLKWKGWHNNKNKAHASLFQIAFVPELLSLFKQVCAEKIKFIDLQFFKRAVAQHKKVYLFDASHLSVGMKGMEGRAGIGIGHRMQGGHLVMDRDMHKLKELIGEDYKYYL